MPLLFLLITEILTFVAFYVGYKHGKQERIVNLAQYKPTHKKTTLKVLHKKIPKTQDEERLEAIESKKPLLKRLFK